MAALLACGFVAALPDLPAASPGRAVRSDPVEMVTVPAGEFLMGSDDPEADADERPAARIRLSRRSGSTAWR